ncbi:hypothetical protein TSUD_230760 [Trifolium subterraneum]|nr:hypothetical protein TSUD_230760 [Trifolium subterraneum]
MVEYKKLSYQESRLSLNDPYGSPSADNAHMHPFYRISSSVLDAVAESTANGNLVVLVRGVVFGVFLSWYRLLLVFFLLPPSVLTWILKYLHDNQKLLDAIQVNAMNGNIGKSKDGKYHFTPYIEFVIRFGS